LFEKHQQPVLANQRFWLRGNSIEIVPTIGIAHFDPRARTTPVSLAAPERQQALANL
jgi:hypothetical protein